MSDQPEGAVDIVDPKDADDFFWELGNQLDLLAKGEDEVCKVLVVDDEPDITAEIAEDLSDEGWTCLTAADGNQALDVIRAEPRVGIVIADLRMPGMDGMELIRHLREDEDLAEREIAVIVLTGHGGYDDAVLALRRGAFEFLTKPVALEHLEHVVGRAEERQGLKAHQKSLQDFMGAELGRLGHYIEQLRAENQELKALLRQTKVEG